MKYPVLEYISIMNLILLKVSEKTFIAYSEIDM